MRRAFAKAKLGIFNADVVRWKAREVDNLIVVIAPIMFVYRDYIMSLHPYVVTYPEQNLKRPFYGDQDQDREKEQHEQYNLYHLP